MGQETYSKRLHTYLAVEMLKHKLSALVDKRRKSGKLLCRIRATFLYFSFSSEIFSKSLSFTVSPLTAKLM